MKDVLKENLVELYREYCEYIDADDYHVTDHDYYKNSLSGFMFWLKKGFIDDFIINN